MAEKRFPEKVGIVEAYDALAALDGPPVAGSHKEALACLKRFVSQAEGTEDAITVTITEGADGGSQVSSYFGPEGLDRWEDTHSGLLWLSMMRAATDSNSFEVDD